MASSTETLNRLSTEKSPYLLQHARNPVDWYPWGNEAFDRAQTDDKPIFLSIGYSTCHWCHVMERESFSDEEIGEILSNHFVAIKVDREERPDIDVIYMSACQALTGQGGWPLTIIMTPSQEPFFAGTYFPKSSGQGLPGLREILNQISRLWNTDRDRLLKFGGKIRAALNTNIFSAQSGDISKETLDLAYAQFEAAFDPKNGGFGSAPKFPTPHKLSFLLRYWKSAGSNKALEMVKSTLNAMYRGGIWDHIGYGFARYSTDNKWLIPHFEKMLYDNALLAITYLEAYQASGTEAYATTARQIFAYVLRDLTGPEGGFYSAEDAESEGEEGKFYLWTPAEVKQVLGQDLGGRFCREYNITARGNYEGKSIPNLLGTESVTVGKEARLKLFHYRLQRTQLFKDDKILTAWNGLMIAALAFGSRVLADQTYLKAAAAAASFIKDNLRRKDGRLLARYRNREAGILAYLDDYAFLIWGLIELYQASSQSDHLTLALDLTADMVKYFWDYEDGGFYLTGTDGEDLIARPKESFDSALPSGNSVAAVNLIRLARLTGLDWLEEKSKQELAAFGGNIAASPQGHAHFLIASWLDQVTPLDITISGDPTGEDAAKLLVVVNDEFIPELNLKFSSQKAVGDDLSDCPSATRKEGDSAPKAKAQVCKNYTCYQAVSEAQELKDLLRRR